MSGIDLSPVLSALGLSLSAALSAVGSAVLVPASLFVTFWFLVWLIYPQGVADLWASYRAQRLFESARMSPSFRARRVAPLWASGRRFPTEVWAPPRSLAESEGGAFELSGMPEDAADDAEVFL